MLGESLLPDSDRHIYKPNYELIAGECHCEWTHQLCLLSCLITELIVHLS